MHCSIYGSACLEVMGPLYSRCVGRISLSVGSVLRTASIHSIAAVLSFYRNSRRRG